MSEPQSENYVMSKAVFWMVAGILVTVYLIIEGINVYQVMRGGARATAHVIATSDEVREADDGRRAGLVTVAEYKFLVAGKQFTGSTEGSQGSWSKGDQLTIEFNPDAPNQNRVVGDRQSLGNYLLLVFFGGIFAFYTIRLNIGKLQKIRLARKQRI